MVVFTFLAFLTAAAPTVHDNSAHRRSGPDERAEAESPKARFDDAVAAFQAGECERAIPALEALAAEGYRSSETGAGLRTCYEKVHGIEGSIEHLENAVRSNPDDAVARTSLGLFYLVKGRKDEAQREMTRALKISPKDLDARLNLAFWYAHVGQTTAAVAELESVLADDGRDRRALTELCSVLAGRANDPKRALPYCERMAALDPTDEPYGVTLGLVRMQLADMAGAEAAFRAVVDANPKALQARTMLASALLHRGDYEEAEDGFESVLSVAPDHHDAQVGLARAYQAKKEHGKAVDAYRALYAKQGGGMLFGALVKAYLQQYFFLIIFALLALMGLLLWRYLNVRVPEATSRTASATQ